MTQVSIKHMNPRFSSRLTVHQTTANLKERMTNLLFVAIAFSTISLAAPGVHAGPTFLPNVRIVSTVPPNGDLNPYGVAFVPANFASGNGPLQPGDILVSNFNNSDNLQGTGTTIVRIPANGPGPMRKSSRIRNPCSGPIGVSPFPAALKTCSRCHCKEPFDRRRIGLARGLQ